MFYGRGKPVPDCRAQAATELLSLQQCQRCRQYTALGSATAGTHGEAEGAPLPDRPLDGPQQLPGQGWICSLQPSIAGLGGSCSSRLKLSFINQYPTSAFSRMSYLERLE